MPRLSNEEKLIKAVKTRDYKNVKRLLKNGVSANTMGDIVDSALHIASGIGHRGIVELLIKHGARINYRRNGDRKTALHIAVVEDNNNIVKLLIKHGANIDAQDNGRDTPIHIAIRRGNTAVFKTLLESGADITIKNYLGNDAIEHAQEFGRDEIEQILKIYPYRQRDAIEDVWSSKTNWTTDPTKGPMGRIFEFAGLSQKSLKNQGL